MRYEDLGFWSEKAGKWAVDYHATLGGRPVRSACRPGDIARQIPAEAPERPEPMDRIMADFERIIPDGMTHWQHPRFMAYFPANAAPASIIAEQLVNSMACNCMLWQASPAATELETVMVDWLRSALGLPAHFTGLIHDTATVATFCAILTMRERALGWTGNRQGLKDQRQLRIYASGENHNSVDRAVRFAGIGEDNLVKIDTDGKMAMEVAALRQAVEQDIARGFTPAGVVICVGGTANGACDPCADIIQLARSHDLYTHVDAAWAGSAMICPEFREMWRGVGNADSLVVNAHKWLGAQLECSVQFLADTEPQRATMGMQAEYLKTDHADGTTDLNELTLPLGRRFRALKLWFVLRAHGLEGLRDMIRNHVSWIRSTEARFEADPDFEIVSRSRLAMFTFRFNPGHGDPDRLTTELLNRINDDGRIFLTRASCGGKTVIRVVAGSFECTREDIGEGYRVTRDIADSMCRSHPAQ